MEMVNKVGPFTDNKADISVFGGSLQLSVNFVLRWNAN